MANPEGNSGIRADMGRPLAMLRKDNYRAWAFKLNAQLKVSDIWRLVSGVEAEPPFHLVLITLRSLLLLLSAPGG